MKKETGMGIIAIILIILSIIALCFGAYYFVSNFMKKEKNSLGNKIAEFSQVNANENANMRRKPRSFRLFQDFCACSNPSPAAKNVASFF